MAGKDSNVAKAVEAAGSSIANSIKVARDMLPNAPSALTIGVQTPNLLSQLSTVIALVFGTAGLPHILIMFYTVKSAEAAKKSVMLCIVLLGIFYLCTIFLGFMIMLQAYPQLVSWIAAGKYGVAKNMSVLLISEKLGGQILMAISAAGAIAAILSTAAGLMITVSSSISHDLYKAFINPDATEQNEIMIARITTLLMTVISVILAFLLKKENVARLVTLAFSIAASSIFPVMLTNLWWKGLTVQGAIGGMITGLVISLIFIVLLLSEIPTFLGLPTAGGPGVFGVTCSFIVLFVISLLTKKDEGNAAEFLDKAHDLLEQK